MAWPPRAWQAAHTAVREYVRQHAAGGNCLPTARVQLGQLGSPVALWRLTNTMQSGIGAPLSSRVQRYPAHTNDAVANDIGLDVAWIQCGHLGACAGRARVVALHPLPGVCRPVGGAPPRRQSTCTLIPGLPPYSNIHASPKASTPRCRRGEARGVSSGGPVPACPRVLAGHANTLSAKRASPIPPCLARSIDHGFMQHRCMEEGGTNESGALAGSSATPQACKRRGAGTTHVGCTGNKQPSAVHYMHPGSRA